MTDELNRARRLVEPLIPDDHDLLLDLVDVGWSVWERQDNPDAQTIRGGTVVEVKHLPGLQVFVVLDFPHGKPDFTDLARDEIDPTLCALPNNAVIRAAARRLQALAGRSKGAVAPFELRCSATALRLLEVIA